MDQRQKNGWVEGRWINGRLDVCRINGQMDDDEGMRDGCLDT